MDILKAVNLLFRYRAFSPKEDKDVWVTALDGIDLSVSRGEFAGILGHNGSGKSTLARQLAGLLTPQEGYVYIDGMDSRNKDRLLEIRKTAGMVFQNPDNQLIGNVVEEDVAFGPENLGLPPEEIRSRVADALRATGMEEYRYRSPDTLSGGQKQKIAMSGILAMQPECIILDEPTAMLDPRGRREVLEAVTYLNREKGITIILITHRPEELEHADKIYVMKEGKVMASGTPAEIWKQRELLLDCGTDVPRSYRSEDKRLRENMHSDNVEGNELSGGEVPTELTEGSVLSCQHVSYRYPSRGDREEEMALKDVSFTIRQGEFAALIGRTGSGKSTLLQQLNGLLTPTEGVCSYRGQDIHGRDVSLRKVRRKVALCFQYPEDQLFEETVLKDICFGPSNMGFTPEECREKARQAMEMLGIPPETESLSPLSLSGGQKRKVALAGILAMEPEFLLLDEPAAGLDLRGKRSLFSLLKRRNREKNMGILLVSHDMDDVAENARRVIVMDRGRIVMDGNTGDVFAGKEELRRIGLDLSF